MTQDPETPEAPPLVRRPPRSIWIHIGVDFLIALLALLFLFWVIGLPLWLTIVVAWIAGIVAAPFTRRAEERALAERPEAPA
jgi:uncharacterized integral membrane protein